MRDIEVIWVPRQAKFLKFRNRPERDLAVRFTRLRPKASPDMASFVSTRVPDAAASTASRPAFVTIAIRPSVRRDSESSKCDLGQVGTEIFFGKTEIRLDTPVNKRPDGQIKGASRSTRDAEIPADMKHPVSAIVHCGIVSKNVARLNNPVNDAAAVAGMLTDYCDQRP